MRFKEFLGEWVTTTLESLTKNEKKSFAGGPFGSDLKAEDYTLDGVPIIQLSNITEDYLNFNERLIFTSEKKADSLISNNAYPGDLIIAKMMPAGRCCIAQNLYNRYVLGSDAIRVNLDVKKCNKLFMREQINTQNIRKKITSKTAGSTRQRIGIPELKNLTLFSPSIEEQNKIGAFLLKLDTRIETQSKIIEDLELYKNKIAHQLIYNNPLLDKTTPLKKHATLKNGYAFKSDTYSKSGNYKVITIANVTGNKYISTTDCNSIETLPKDIQSHQILKLGDILISLTGNVGRVSIVNEINCLLNQRVGVLFFTNIQLKKYLFQVLSNKLFETKMVQKGQGAAQKNIGNEDVESFLIPISNNLEYMNKITEVLDVLDEKLALEKQILEKLKEQKKFLLSNMFI